MRVLDLPQKLMKSKLTLCVLSFLGLDLTVTDLKYFLSECSSVPPQPDPSNAIDSPKSKTFDEPTQCFFTIYGNVSF